MAEIIGIYISPDKDVGMTPLTQVEAIAGKGLAGDRYAEGRGAFPPNKVREVSLIASEAIDMVNSNREQPFTPAQTRRNLITAGIYLNELVGEVFMVGDGVVMRGTELCDPCARPDRRSGNSGFKEAFQNRGGLRAEILSSGIIAVRNAIIAPPRAMIQVDTLKETIEYDTARNESDLL